MSSPFQHTSAARGKVNARKAEYQKTFAPDGKDYHKAKTRRNAYVTVTAGGVTLPLQANSYDALYSNTEGKPDVTLDSVSINEGSDFGMLRTVEVQFTCLRRSTFTSMEKAFLRPGKELTVKYGYVDGSDSGDGSDYVICKYNYELDSKNRYKCGFKAYGATPFINELEVDLAGDFGSEEVTVQGFYKAPVKTLAQHLKFVAQGDGLMANVDIENWTTRAGGAVVVLDNPSAWTPDNFFTKKVHKILQAIGLLSGDTSKKIFCTLEWFFQALQSNFIAPNLTAEMKGRRIVCNSRVTSGRHEIEQIGSAYPMSIVLPGGSKGSSGGPGHYGSGPDHSGTEQEMNFTANCQTCISGKRGDYSKILISYEYIMSKLFGSSKEKGSVKKTKKEGKKDKPSVKLSTVLETLFDDIFAATGGMVQLATQENPKNSKELMVIARNFGQSGIRETVFDPIKGDGITRKCTIKCDIPANDAYAVANGGGGGKQGYTTDAIAEKEAKDAKQEAADQYSSNITALANYMEDAMAANEYENGDCDALAAIFKFLVDKATKEQVVQMSIDDHIWPLELEIELDGASGFRFGDVVNTTFLPGNYTSSGIKPSFVVLESTQEIKGNDWTTKLKTQCHLLNK